MNDNHGLWLEGSVVDLTDKHIGVPKEVAQAGNTFLPENAARMRSYMTGDPLKAVWRLNPALNQCISLWNIYYPDVRIVGKKTLCGVRVEWCSECARVGEPGDAVLRCDDGRVIYLKSRE